MLLFVTENPPEALIEEARQLQRKRKRRRSIILGAAAAFVALGFGIYQLAQGGNNVGATPPAAAGAAQPPPAVTYEKIVIRRFVPHLPVETTTIETWTAPDGTSNRRVVTNDGGPRIEISTAPGIDKVLGPVKMNYLYDTATGKIYRAGYELPPLTKPPSNEQQFKRVVAQPYVHLAGTTTYRGRKVYVLKLKDEENHGTVYVDERTYEPLMQTQTGTDMRLDVRTLAYKTLPATPANVALTSLPSLHPKARIVLHPTLRIRELYGEAAFPPGQHA
jgi:hypothetical protein